MADDNATTPTPTPAELAGSLLEGASDLERSVLNIARAGDAIRCIGSAILEESGNSYHVDALFWVADALQTLGASIEERRGELFKIAHRMRFGEEHWQKCQRRDAELGI